MNEFSWPPKLPQADDVLVQQVSCKLLNLLPDLSGKRLVAAISGGPDSTALLAALASLRSRIEFELDAAHVNHGLRGDESMMDETFCRNLCEVWKVEFHLSRLDGSITDESGLRARRYDYFETLLLSLNASTLLTGHTLDDQTETMLFRLFRGTGPLGLSGIPDDRGLGLHRIVRPMLLISRRDVLAFLERTGLPHRHDSSNDEKNYTRNYVRHEIIPRIEERFPGFQLRLQNLRLVVDDDEKLLDELVSKARHYLIESRRSALSAGATLMSGGVENSQSFEVWCRRSYCEQPISIRRRLIARSLTRRGIESKFDNVERIGHLIDLGKGVMSLNRDWQIRVASEYVKWAPRAVSGAGKIIEVAARSVQIPGVTCVEECRAQLQIEVYLPQRNGSDQPLRFPEADSFEALVDLSSLHTVEPERVWQAELHLRSRRPGDRIQPFGMNQLVRLKKYLHTHAARTGFGTTLVLANAHEVLWVPGVGLSEKLRVHSQPTHIFRLVEL